MNNKKLIISLIVIAVTGAIGIFFVGSNPTEDQNNNQEAQNQTDATGDTQISQDLLTYVDKDDQVYKDMKGYLQGDIYDQHFIANMIHYSEGLDQLETKAIEISNDSIARGAQERATKAAEDIQMYKQLQEEKNYPLSYGAAMEYHGAMGADASAYVAISSLEGLTGDEYEKMLIEKLREFRLNITLLAAVGIGNDSADDITELVNDTLAYNKAALDILQ